MGNNDILTGLSAHIIEGKVKYCTENLNLKKLKILAHIFVHLGTILVILSRNLKVKGRGYLIGIGHLCTNKYSISKFQQNRHCKFLISYARHP